MYIFVYRIIQIQRYCNKVPKLKFTVTGDILNASDVLDEVFEKYNEFVNETKTKINETPQTTTSTETNNETLLDFAGANVRRPDGDAPKPAPKNNVIDELGDIFATESGAGNIAEPLKPVNLMPGGNTPFICHLQNNKKKLLVNLTFVYHVNCTRI